MEESTVYINVLASESVLHRRLNPHSNKNSVGYEVLQTDERMVETLGA